MAQATSNLVQQPNKVQGLLGLGASMGGSTTPALISPKPTPTLPTYNFTPNLGGSTQTAAAAQSNAPIVTSPQTSATSLDTIKNGLLDVQSKLNSFQQQQSAPTQTNTASKGLFPDVVSALANPQPSQMTIDSEAAYQKAYNDLNKFKQSVADTKSSIYDAPVSARVMQGRAAALQQANAEKLAAYQGAVQQAQAGIGFGQNQQSLNQSALSSAAGFAKPELGGIGQVPFSPTDLSQGAVLGSTQPGGLQAAGALLGGFNAAQSNAQTQGTAFTNTAAAGFGSSLPAYQAAKTSFDQASNQSQNLLNSMTNINALGSQYANSKINQLKNQFGSTQYATFVTALAEAQQSYTQLLASVGAATPTVNGQQATQILNENSTPAQISAAINALNQAAYAKLQPLYQQAQTYQSALQGGGSQGVNTSASGFGWNG